DLAIFYGSACEAVGLQPILFLVPGHCFPAIRLPKSGRIFAVESTGIQKANFQQVRDIGAKEVEDYRRKGLVYEVNVVDLHNKGYSGFKLPPFPPSPLTAWGIPPATAQAAAAPATRQEPAAPATTNRPALPDWLVGQWQCDTNIKQARIQMTAN